MVFTTTANTISFALLLLPKLKDIAKDFPLIRFGSNADCEKSLAKISLIYAVFSQATLNAKIDAFKEKFILC